LSNDGKKKKTTVKKRDNNDIVQTNPFPNNKKSLTKRVNARINLVNDLQQ